MGPAGQDALAWQPQRAGSEVWRCWSAAWVHLSARHLLVNLLGTVLVVALGWAARVGPRAALAWALAWPLTQLGLLAQPALPRYGGLSGVLHAGVAVVAVHLLFAAGGRASHRLGLAILAVLVAKLWMEAFWRGPLSHPAGWDIAVAPFAHVSGVFSGLLCGLLCLGLPRLLQKRTS